jgi:hypothetical protein
MCDPTAWNPSDRTFARPRAGSWLGGRKFGGLVWWPKLIMEDMFRYAVFSWLAVAGLVTAAPVRAAADLAAGCPLAGKRS